MKKLISIVTGCYNEQENVADLYQTVKEIFATLPQYNYEHIFADNSSQDNTVAILKELAKKDKNLKIIINSRNFGPNKSGYNAILQAKGDAVITMVADFQDPPKLIKEFLQKWEQGFKIVTAIKNKSEESFIMFNLRKLYYKLVKNLGEIDHIENFTGFGLYDKAFVDNLRKLNDPVPYFRGLVAEFGYDMASINYTQPKRKRGKSSHSFYVLYDIAMQGFVTYSKIPLRLASFIGFIVAGVSFLSALFYLIYKIIFWNSFQVGMAPLVIGIFFFSAVQLFFIGIIGEYIGAIYTQVKNRPLVIEKERINFD